jgi:hypothetical protein
MRESPAFCSRSTEHSGDWAIDGALSHEKGQHMFTAQQYRAKSDEYESFLRTDRSPAEAAEYRDLQRSYASLADNLEWLAANGNKTVQAASKSAEDIARSERQAEDAEQEQVLRCLGAAVLLNWNKIPTDLQRSLFEAASSVKGEQRGRLKSVLAQFLHDHKDDAENATQQNGG